MSREIKFRAWNNANNEWLNKEDAECLTIYLDGRYEIDMGWVKVFPDLIIEQYTGLKDKNGKEIYEGDIVKCYSRRKLIGEYQVIWNEDCGGFECESLKPLVDGGDRMLRDVRVFNEISIQFRVIGNIHENPELLEDK